jgi:acyl-coenzyme A synthetase/AMP-(fatty) acid ligase
VLKLALARLGAASAVTKIAPGRVALCLVQEGAPSGGHAPAVDVDPSWFAAPPPGAAVAPVASGPGDDAICGYFSSSGTTGEPKIVAISHRVFANRIIRGNAGVPLPSEPRQICTLSPGTAYGFWAYLRMLQAGGVSVMVSKVEDVAPAVAAHRVNLLELPPNALERIIATLPPGAPRPPSLVQVDTGGSHLTAPLFALARERLCPRIISFYGSTEGGCIAAGLASEMAGALGAVGWVIEGVETEAVTADGTAVRPGTEGLLRVRSDNCVDGYVDDADATAASFRDGWFYSGDLGTVGADGLVCVSGRRNDVINMGGGKINPQVVEEVLLSFDWIRDAAAFGVPDALGLTRIWAAIVADRAVDMEALEARCRLRLGAMAPRFVLQMRALPRNDTGKILYRELIEFAQKSSEVSAR